MSARARWFLVLLGLLIGACEQAPNGNPFERWADASTEKERFYVLADAAKADVRDGSLATAATKATELLELAAKHRDNWNYGNAIHDGNLVLAALP
jgi:hypothetical protein